MKAILIGLCWGAALLMLGFGNRLGLIADDTATMLFAILPVLAVIAIGSGRPCVPAQA